MAYKPVYRTVWGQTPKYAAKRFASSYETSRAMGVPEGDDHLIYAQMTPEDSARVGAELEDMGYTVVYVDIFNEGTARGIWIVADKKSKTEYRVGAGGRVAKRDVLYRREVRVRGHGRRSK